ncbi:MAG TPA: DUF58 domain-containing protein [Blastocatellia bacterium]|nr:DUF58 domain-containing protein [Blastocatellia bacterium]
MNDSYREYLIAGEKAGMRYALEPPRTASAPLAGLQLGRQAGASLEFRDHRDYQPGDDLRRIDWNAFARSDRLTVKLYREEISPHLDVVLDGSRSMALEGAEKARAAIGLAAAFAVAAENAGYSHNAWLARAFVEPVANGSNRPASWRSLDLDFRGNPAEAFTRTPPGFRRQGMRVLISDLLWLGEPATILQILAQGAASLVVAQTLASVDADPPERGRVRLLDSETDERREIFIDDGAIRRYREALARHQQNWYRACRQIGAVMVNVIAEEVVADWNLESLVKAGVLKV